MTETEFIKTNGQWIDEVAEANDHLGTCQGIAFTLLYLNPSPGFSRDPLKKWVNVVQLVFEHGIVDARRDTLKLLSIRTLTRFDET